MPWIRTDEAEEAIAALEMVGRFAADASRDPFAWRWVILALHNSLQGFMVIAIRDTAGLFPLPEKLAAKWLQAHEARAPYPKERLDSFPNLYRKIQSEEIANHLQAKPFQETRSQRRSVDLLHCLRNQFIHFLPASWSLQVSGLPRICLDCLTIVEFLFRDYRFIIWDKEEHLGRFTAALAEARRVLEPLERDYEESAV